MPRPFNRGRGGYSRRMSRSLSRSPNRNKRSWLQSSDRQPRSPLHNNRSPSPQRGAGPRKRFRPSPVYQQSPPKSRSRSPPPQKRPAKWRSQKEGHCRFQTENVIGAVMGGGRSRQPLHGRGEGRPSEMRGKPRSRSRSRHRSLSPKPPPRVESSGRPHHHPKGRKMSSPDIPIPKKKPRQHSSPVPPSRKHQRHHSRTPPPGGPPRKQQQQQRASHSPPPRRKRSVSRDRDPRNGSPGLNFSMGNSRESLRPGAHQGSGGVKVKMPSSSRPGKGMAAQESAPSQRKVSSASAKKRPPRMTLDKRFSLDDQQRPFQLNASDNVTIAILRNPDAQPSEDVTVEKIFDPTLFKMVHRKHEGRRPIFDREEIKVWRHDENLTDDPDFERRLIRVKSAPKKVADSLSRMSPDMLRKAFGRNYSRDRSTSQSPIREQKIRLDPRPDPKYEAKYRRHMEKEAEMEKHSKAAKKRINDEDERQFEDRKDGQIGSKKRNKDDSYDLRHALERRRSDREESSFRIEVRRDDDRSSVERGYGSGQHQRRFSDDDRNVVINRKLMKYAEEPMDSPHGRENARIGDAGRGGRGRRGRGRFEGETIRRQELDRGAGRDGSRFRPDWSPEGGMADERKRDSSFERRNNRSFERLTPSPPGNRGWRGRGGGGFRGRGRGFSREFDSDPVDGRSSPPQESYFKYSQHDDRDVSPRTFRGRSSFRGRSVARGFGSKNFRGTRGFRGGVRSTWGYRGRGRGRGGLSRDRDGGFHDVSVEREWKHDMYDSLQKEEPHSTSAS